MDSHTTTNNRRAAVLVALRLVLGLAAMAAALWLMSGAASAAPSDTGTATGPEGGVMVSVSAGYGHSCAVRSSDPAGGVATCWGDDSFNQANAGGVPWAVQVSAGGYHSCSLGSDGAVTCWGSSTDGQTTVPPGFYTKVSAGQSHTCAIRINRQIACWGDNSTGEGNPPPAIYRDVSAGESYTCGVRIIGGALACWGRDDRSGRTRPPAGEFIQVSAGWSHACGLRSDGQIVCWGQGNTGAQSPPAGPFRQVSAGGFKRVLCVTYGTVVCWPNLSIVSVAPPPAGEFIQVSVGSGHACGVRSTGEVSCWRTSVVPPAGKFMLPAVAAGGSNTCGVKWSDAQLSCWGNNGSADPRPPAGTFLQVSPGASHTCGVHSDGTVACSGLNDKGQANPPAGAFNQVSAGESHTCGVRSDFTLACWGLNDKGQASPPTGRFIEVSAGDMHTCALGAGGTLACWGDNTYGQASPPVLWYDSVSAGGTHSCAITLSGYVECWGNNNLGQRDAPPLQAVQVRAGGFHTCELAFNHTAICWGQGVAGQPVLPNRPYASLTAGTAHTCAVEQWRAVICSGHNPDGRGTPLMTSPVPPNGPAGAPYNHRFTTTFVTPALQFTLRTGSLPPGLSLGLGGGLVGTPTTDGSYSAMVCAFSSPPFAPEVCQSFTITIAKGKPTISLKASAGGPMGTPVRATATMTGGFPPYGRRVVFGLFSDSTCNTLVFSPPEIDAGDGKAISTPDFTPSAPGTYYWTVTYNGTANNEPAIAPCGTPGQSVVIVKASPTLMGKASPGGARGTPLRDTGTLAGGYKPTGTMTFRLYSDANCATQIFASTKNLVGLAVTSNPFTPTTAGTYRWRAFYNGDANNKAVATACNATQPDGRHHPDGRTAIVPHVDGRRRRFSHGGRRRDRQDHRGARARWCGGGAGRDARGSRL